MLGMSIFMNLKFKLSILLPSRAEGVFSRASKQQVKLRSRA